MKWPNRKKIAVNVNLDDFHPESSSVGIDYGGDMENGVMRYLFELLADHPTIKFTLFTTANWRFIPEDRFLTRLLCRCTGIKIKKWPENEFKLNKYPHWCEFARNLVNTKRFEIAIHGLEHYNKHPIFGSPLCGEFSGLNYEECIYKLINAEKIFKQAHIMHSKGFRAPAWDLNINLLKSLNDLNYLYISGLRKSKNFNLIRNKLEFGPENTAAYGRLIDISPNWDISMSEERLLDATIKEGQLLCIAGHIQSNATDGLNRKNYDNLRNILDYLESTFGDGIWYATLEEIARWIKDSKI